MRQKTILSSAWTVLAVMAQSFFLFATKGLAQPSIGTQPASQTVAQGSTVTFSVAATPSAGFISYQWQFNGTNLPNQIISTVAGGGIASYSGDGAAATNAGIGSPYGVAVDTASNIFISDYYNSRVRKVGANGIITTVAGNGTFGYSGDGGQATNASLSAPRGIAVDGSGDLFMADYWNNCIRKVAANGIITTVAGNGSGAYSGDNGAATNATLYFPQGVAVDAAGDLFIADTGNSRIRKVGTNGIITTVAGGGTGGDGGLATSASLYGPGDVVLDAVGDLFIADNGNNRVRKVGTNGIITTVAGNGFVGYAGDNGSATNASLTSPVALALDVIGNIFIVDNGNNRIREVGTNGIISTVAGNGTAGFSGDGGAASNAMLSSPAAVVLDANENLYVADKNNNRIREVTLAGSQNLVLKNVTTANDGNYQAILTDFTGSVTSSVTILKEISLLQAPPTASAITNGNALSASILAGGAVTNSAGGVVAGTFAFTSPSIVPVLTGVTNVSVTFTPASSADYNPFTLGVNVTVVAPLGVAAVQFTSTPVISGTSLTISATNTGAGTVYLLSSTNVAAQLSTWTPVWTNTFAGSSSFTTNLSNLVNPAPGQNFYILSTTNN
jgi:hypothetical protein